MLDRQCSKALVTIRAEAAHCRGSHSYNEEDLVMEGQVVENVSGHIYPRAWRCRALQINEPSAAEEIIHVSEVSILALSRGLHVIAIGTALRV